MFSRGCIFTIITAQHTLIRTMASSVGAGKLDNKVAIVTASTEGYRAKY